jgi:hypothetical protein
MADQTICSTAGDDCVAYPTPCPQPAGGPLVACLDGTCENFPPAAWQSFSMMRQVGTLSVHRFPPVCAVDDCSGWTITPDARVAITKRGQSSASTLSTADFATVDAILRDRSFREGFSCDPAPADEDISGVIKRGGLSTGFSVAGCVLTGPKGNAYQRLFEVLQSY